MRTRRKITIERERLLVIRRRKEAEVWCEGCKAPRKMVEAREAAVILGISARTIFRRVEAGQLHFTETPDGAVLICLDSLLGRLE